jgi:hypothetical protein
MPDVWFIFDNNGQLLFKTADKNKTILNTLPTNFRATYVIKNPKINPLAYTYKLNLTTKNVESITQPSLENTNSTELGSAEIHNYVEKIDEFTTKISILQVELQETVEELVRTKDELTRTKNEINQVSARTTSIINTVDSVLTNSE